MRVKLNTELWLAMVGNEIILAIPWAMADGKPAPGIAIPIPIVLHEGKEIEIKYAADAYTNPIGKAIQ